MAKPAVLVGTATHLRAGLCGAGLGAVQTMFGWRFPGWFDDAAALGLLVAATLLVGAVCVLIVGRFTPPGALLDRIGVVVGGLGLVGGSALGFLPGIVADGAATGLRIAAWMLLTGAILCAAAVLFEKRAIER